MLFDTIKILFDPVRLEFPLFLVAIVINVGLAMVVIRYALKSISNFLFLLFLATQILWLISTHFTLEAIARGSVREILLLIRIVMFFATLHSLFMFFFVLTFQKRKEQISKWSATVLFTSALFISGIALSSYVFPRMAVNSQGEYLPQAGPGIMIFGIFSAFCILGSFITLMRRYGYSSGTEKSQLKYLMSGMIMSYSLVFGFSFMYTNIFHDLNGVRLGYLYTLPFVILTTYAILKHHFLDIRIFTTEIFAFLIIAISVIQLTFARTVTEFTLSAILLLSLLVLGYLLIKSMSREIHYRAQEQAYEKLQRLDTEKARFITTASHQLRTPVSIIGGYVSMILEGAYKDAKEEQKALGRIAEANGRLVNLIDTLLDVSRMEDKKIEIHIEDVKIKELLEEVIKEFTPRAESKNLQISYFGEHTTIPSLKVDKEKIRMVLAVVLDNTIRYTKEGNITITSTVQKKRAHSFVQIAVADTGEGLATEEKETIFQSFNRGEGAQSLWTEGVGLNLYIARKFIEAHGGKIWAESAGKGNGSTFYVELPAT